MKKAYSVVLSLLMVMSLCTFEVGCTSTQFNNTIATINAELPSVQALAGDLATLTGNSQVTSATAALVTAIAADLPVLQSAVTSYLANKASGTKNAIFAAVNALATSVNAQVLAANKVLDPKSQAAALQKIAAIAAVVNGFQLVLAPFFNSTASAKAQFQQVQPFIPRATQEQVAAMYGYNLGQLGL